MTTEQSIERATARYVDHYWNMTYKDFLTWQQGGEEVISQGEGML